MPKRITSVEWQASSVPAGLAFNSQTGTFSGTPTTAGDYTVPVTVTTNYGTDTKDVAINVGNSIVAIIDNMYVTKCIDTGNEVIFFGSTDLTHNSTTAIGLYFTYNPSSGETSKILRLIDDEPYALSDTTTETLAFKSCAIDPVSKKWIVFFGTHYIKTLEGVRDVSDDLDFKAVACCWSDKLQKFCAITTPASTTTAGQTPSNSYIFDVNGNLVDSSTQINSISTFKMRLEYGQKLISWSNTANMFVAITTTTTTTASTFLRTIYSSDGLTWTLKNKSVGANYTAAELITLSNGSFLLAANYATGTVSDGGTYTVAFYKSSDGLNWEKSGGFAQHAISMVENPNDGNIYILVNTDATSSAKILYVTEDFTEFSQYKSITYGNLPSRNSDNEGYIEIIYSTTANAFAIPKYVNGFTVTE